MTLYPKSRDETGSSTVEAVVLVPVLMVFVLLSIAFGRYEMTSAEVVGAAQSAAESAAIMPSGTQAVVAANQEAMLALSGSKYSCSTTRVTTDVAHFVPSGNVTVIVSCELRLSDLGAPGVPGSTTVVAVQIAPIDPFRAVS